MTNNTAIKQQPLTLDISKEALADINETLEKMTRASSLGAGQLA